MFFSGCKASRRRTPTIEKLHERCLFAVVQGVVAIDTNHNGAFDASGTSNLDPRTEASDQPVAGALVWLDVNGNKILDGQDAQTRSDSEGNYAFDQVPVGNQAIYVMPNPGLVQTSSSHVVHFYEDFATGRFGLASTDVNTGDVTTITAAGGELNLFGLVETRDGEYYATSFITDSLYRIDPISGQQTLVGDLGKGIIGDLAYDPVTDTIYTLAHDQGVDPNDGLLTLYTIDRSTAKMTAVNPEKGVLGVRGTSAMAFDTVERRLVIFDNNRNEFISYDLQGEPTILSISTGPLAFFNMFFDGSRFLTVIPVTAANTNLSQLFEVNLQDASLEFVRTLDMRLHGEGAHAISTFQPIRVNVESESQIVIGQDFLVQPLDLPDSKITLVDSGTNLESDSKKISEFSPIEPRFPTTLYCIAKNGTSLTIAGSSSESQNKIIKLGPANDTVEASGPIQLRMSAGSGVDTVRFTSKIDLDLAAWVNNIEGVDVIDLRPSGGSTLTPLPEHVIAISDTKKLTVLANDEDTVELASAGWKLSFPTSNNAVRLHHFASGEALLDLINEHGWLNPISPLDVNADGSITAMVHSARSMCCW